MKENLDTRRILIYLAFAFGIAWATSLVVYLTGGLQDSPMLIPAANVSLAFVLLAGPVMWAPALAHVLTRLITKEGWRYAHLRPRLREGWPYWLAAWLVPALLTIAGLVIYFLLFPRNYDSELSTLREMLEAAPVEPGEINLWVLVAVQVFQGLLLAPFINGIATFGEEFGWRGYLQPKLTALGLRRAMVLMGVIWGVWHWPAILMGHNYGLNYPGAPFLGPLAMVWFTLIVGTLLGWLTFKAGSVWPAVIGHAALNGMASLGVVFVRGKPNPLLGPLPVGLVGGLGFATVGLVLLLVPGLWRKRAVAAVD
ncbi:MAG: CPBP family intramembrane metalloprotease [Anaerolineae bacterium]|jgi:membrane protease YdiL (CAAX protease family)